MTAVSRSYEDEQAVTPPRQTLARVGRYVLHPPIARGGMATVHAARLVAAEGVTRLVAAKRLHPHFIDDPEFVAMFHDEARIASRIHHPNVVPVLDVVRSNDEVILVQGYVHGVPLSHLFKLGLGREPMPIAIAAATVAGILSGLHAAHEATDETGEPLGVVHRDVSPQNVILSVDGIPRLVDFGIAKAKTSVHHTREGFFKGKLAYMSPEQIRAEPVSRRADIYAAGVLLWELVVNRRFYEGKNDAEFVRSIAVGKVATLTEALEGDRTLSEERWEAIRKLESIVSRAMATAELDRYTTALVMATELADAVGIASPSEVAAWVRRVGSEYLDERQRVLAANEEVYRTSVSKLAIGRRTISGSRLALPKSTFAPTGDVDEPVKSSGPRVRPSHELAAATPVAPFAPVSPLGMDAPTSPTLSLVSKLDQQFSARSLVPWIVIAGLLVVVGLLTGMMIMREPATASSPASGAMNASSASTGMAVAAAPAAAPEAAPSPTPTPTPASTPASPPASGSPQPVAQQRWVPRPPPVVSRPAASPVSTPTPSTPSTRADCNPPFYFEGNKKVFKLNCL